MTVFVNDEIKTITEGSTLRDLRNQLGLFTDQGYAFALNEKIIPHDEHDNIPLVQDDRIVVIQATQGG